MFITNCVLLCLTVLQHILEHQDIKNHRIQKNSKSRKKRKQNNEEEEEQGESLLMWNDWLLHTQEHTKHNISLVVGTWDVYTCAVEYLPSNSLPINQKI